MATNSEGNVNKGFQISPENVIISVENVSISKNTNTNKLNNDEKGQVERPNWSNGLEFLMSCISMSVGLGNIWRFPFTAYENGGGAFLIPYIIVLFLIGKPMYYLEMILGQFTSRSSVKIWQLSPIFKGVGYGQMWATICVITYYSVLLSLTIFYLINSFSAVLPWSICDPQWGPNCVDSNLAINNESGNLTVPAQSSSELYFLKYVLNEKPDITDGIGYPDWRLTLTLLFSWITVYCVIVRGVKSSGKAAYFLALFPYIVLLALLIRAVTLEGAIKGIIFFLKPNWNDILSPKVWKEAVTQSFFSLGVGLGPVVMFSSYNQFTHGIYRDALIVTSLDTFTSLLAGVTIFGILGNLAHNLQIDDISKVVKSGTGLAFISYPDAISKFDAIPQLFSVLFFFMLYVLGVGSIVALQSAIVTIICDQFPHLRYWKVALFTSIIGFFAGLVYVTPGGQWILNLVDYFGGTFVVFALAVVEMLAIFWIYGLDNFCMDVEFMTKRHVTIYWRLCWGIITPCLMAIIFIYSMTNMEPLRYSGFEYPDSAYIAGWTLLSIGFLQFPLWAFWTITERYNSSKNLNDYFRPSPSWGPRDPTLRSEWEKYKLDRQKERNNIIDTEQHGLIKQKLCILLGKY